MKKVFCTIALACLLIPSLSAAITLERPLTIGSRGPDVSALQQVLLTFGYFQHVVTGYFGWITRGAVVKFQTDNNLEPVGSVGPKTRALINPLINAAIIPEIPPTPPATQTPPALPTPTASSTPTTAPTATSTATSTVTLESNPIPADGPPIITVVTPSILPADTREVTLTLNTDRNATCRFATNPLVAFTNKTSFKSIDTVVHTYDFLNLQNGSLYVYYVECEDTKTLKMSPETTVSFSVANRTAAATPATHSQLASALTSIASFGPWSMMNPVQTILEALGF